MLTLTDLRKSYGATRAVDGLTLEVRPGEILGLLGPNGAGKSTTAAMAAGLLAPDGGSVSLAGGDPARPEVRRKLGLAPQALSLYAALSGEENLRFFGALHDLSGATLGRRVDEALEFVGLRERRRDRVSAYSGGMQRRLNLAAALLHDPELVILDEPTAGVDPQSRNGLFENIEALRARGKTVIYTTHYMEEAARLCDRVAIVDHGRLLALGTVAELTDAHGGPPALIVRRNGAETRVETAEPLAELNRLAAAGPVEEFRVERATLEQVFLHLTGRALRD